MAGKYENLFVTDMEICADDLVNEGAAAGGERPGFISDPWGLMRGVDVPGAPVHMAYSWIDVTDEGAHWVNDHEHTYDEILMWMGSDKEDLKDLGAELYLDIEGERHTTTTTGSVYIPAGTRHCPLGFNWVRRPFQFISLSLSPEYSSDENMPKHD